MKLSSLTRNWTHAPCIGSMEFQPLDCQGSSQRYLFNAYLILALFLLYVCVCMDIHTQIIFKCVLKKYQSQIQRIVNVLIFQACFGKNANIVSQCWAIYSLDCWALVLSYTISLYPRPTCKTAELWFYLIPCLFILDPHVRGNFLNLKIFLQLYWRYSWQNCKMFTVYVVMIWYMCTLWKN